MDPKPITLASALATEIKLAAEDVAEHEGDRLTYEAGYDTGYLRGLLRAEELLVPRQPSS
jgi:hypothetical protein